MSEIYPSPRKSWGAFSFSIIIVMIVNFVAPLNVSPASALDTPQPIYPENYANAIPDTDPPLGVPSFSWSAVSGATTYRLQVDSEISFNTPIVLNITTPNTSYTPASTSYLFADGEWYWRVRVEAPAPIGEWSEIMLFTKSWATDENRPTLLSPVTDAVLAFFNSPDFSWTPVIGAAKYRFQIATNDTFTSLIVNVDTLTTTTQPNNKFVYGSYYWRVIPMDTADHLGTSSDVRSFTMAYGTETMDFDLVPTLLEPANGSFPTFTPTFHWTAVEGAEFYHLQYSTNCDFTSDIINVTTRQTYYSPTVTFPNDIQYCWRVRVESGPAVGDWSETWHFLKQWYLQPDLLTPTNKYITGLYPLYSWTPVPGASRYRIEISKEVDFSTMYESATTANTTYAPQTKYDGTAYYYWRVTPIDGGGELGKANDPQFEFQSYYTSTAPILVYPLYYYLPNNYGTYTMNPIEDRTVPYPIFMWHRVMIPAPEGGVYATAYRIQVDDYPPYFSDPVWEYDTENTSATPTNNDFSPVVGQDYWWRVCPLETLGGACLKNSITGEEWLSQIWQARFDDRPERGLVLPPTSGDAPELLRPAHGQESIEATPLLEWWPFQDATQYQVEISRDATFDDPSKISETVNIPAYAPINSIAQRSLGRTDYGTFYWRVRGYVGGAWGNWSDAWRFQIASQSGWRYTPAPGIPDNQFLIGDDPAGDALESYDLTTLYASQSNQNWFFGFNANLIPSTNMTYVIYIDLDQVDGSGAPISPPLRNYSITTIPAHQPEYALYVDKIAGVIDAQHTWAFTWDQFHGLWDYGQRLIDIAGADVYTSTDYVELQLPYTAIGMSLDTGSASVMLFSVNSTGVVEDSVPDDPEAPGTAQLSRFSAVSDHMNLIFPPNTVSGDPTTIPSILPFYWDWPTGSNPLNPFAGSVLEVHLDPEYTNRVAEFHINSTDSYFGENNVTFLKDIIGDNIYYWRVQPRYMISGFTPTYGAWTGGMSFRRLGLTAQNLQTSITWASPTFTWDMVEGADTYLLQVSTDLNFASTVINQVTPLTSFTPSGTLAQGNYYWRVQVRRYGGIVNDWSQVEQFNLSLPTPTGLTPDENTTVHSAPTLCWDPLIKYSDKPPYEPILTAWKYRLQVSRDENFSTTYESVDTYNNCWTPTKGYQDGTYYWRVAMIDGNGKVGSYSPSATFTKQYPITTLISPISGSVSTTPTFIWTPVDGTATYRFEVSKYTTFSPTYDTIETINTEFSPTKIYDANVVYYWRVAIRDRNGNQGPFTDATIIIGKGDYFFLPLIKR